ncbi:hypothetical protein BGI41_01725 [Methanobrevibacter sp. 87.7]|uniref:DUF5654 family protein n=1 Tax=Methanobrevibacter sp. 87.7 TaxID=387957 RepID=UPI000B5023B0|nr:DUF5654 family protein [Methanobrevibacter sp. 87.7]OWT33573.1 hypothetical protein BGI41_01725 [Methanobrevibacter sp. 87.7]
MSNVGKEVLKTMITLITTAFALIAGLAWNSAISKLIQTFMPAGSELNGLIFYAVAVTIIAVVVTLLLGRMAGKMGVEIDND